MLSNSQKISVLELILVHVQIEIM